MSEQALSSIDPLRAALIQQYAAGETTWFALRERGFETFLEVLAGLGELGLRQPVAAMTGPNQAARQRGLALVRAALKTAS